MADKKTMTSEEKAFLQAKHRQEEAEARNRRKERNARTHRLIQEGAILESVAPHIREMDLDLLKRELMIRLRGLSAVAGNTGYAAINNRIPNDCMCFGLFRNTPAKKTFTGYGCVKKPAPGSFYSVLDKTKKIH